MMHARSKLVYAKSGMIPGRSMTRSKAPGRYFPWGNGPLYASRAQGALIFDVDGNEYVDMVCALGAVSLGYADPIFASESWSLPSDLESVACECILDVLAPWARYVRLTRTGSEATHAAYRIAKRATGRKSVLVGDWAYHGWHEWCDASENPYLGRFSHGEDVTARITPNIAAVFIEPHRWAPIDEHWLATVRAACTKAGAVLVFDEMIYGGRWANGGASELFGIRPDLACYGKAIGNGASVACVVGGDILEKHGEMISGTYSGDIGGLLAISTTLRVYSQRPVVQHLWKVGDQLRVGLEQAIQSSGWAPHVRREGSPVHQRLTFAGDEPSAPALARRFAAGMAERGILWHPQVTNVCYAHASAHITKVTEAAAAVLSEMSGMEVGVDRGDER